MILRINNDYSHQLHSIENEQMITVVYELPLKLSDLY